MVWAAFVAGMGGTLFGWVTALLLQLPVAIFICYVCCSTQKTVVWKPKGAFYHTFPAECMWLHAMPSLHIGALA